MNRSRRRRKRLGLPPYGTNILGVNIPDKMDRRLIKYDGYSGLRPEPIKPPEWVVLAKALIRILNKELISRGYILSLSEYVSIDESCGGCS